MFKNIDIDQSLKNAQTSLLIMIVLTIVNVMGSLLGKGLYLPYSAILPNTILFYASANQMYLFILIVFILIGLYVGVAILARNNPIWYIGATTLYIIDSIVFLILLFNNRGNMFDVFFHAWILYSLTKGSVAAYRKMIQ